MIQTGNDFLNVKFEFPEVYEHIRIVELLSFDKYFDLPVMPVEVFTFLGHHLQLMGGCKVGDHF
jgi:hypothetical protein